MNKRAIFFCVLAVVCFSVSELWAGGKREGNESREASDPAAVTDSIDISGRKPGKYNFYYEAKDKAGNVSLSGPENIYVDPESDLPRTTIINPLPNMHVQGNLNIVGIANDDDGVGRVEFTVTRGMDGKGEELARVTAKGTDYWSYFLDTTDGSVWTDGIYTITAWATDINGLSGTSSDFPSKSHKFHQVYWNLDRKKPDAVVTSHEVGALVAGKITLKGTVTDGNGIGVFSYSTDEGKKYTPVKLSYNKRSDEYFWSVDLNTKSFDDGPNVIWFQSKDGMGTLGTAAHLLFVNNTGPKVNILYPQSDAVVNGVFTIAGSAKHDVGIDSVTWKVDKQSGEFQMVIGNPYWSTDVDLRGFKGNSIEVEIRAVDVSGNVTVARQKYKVDQNLDLPVIAISEPAAGAVISEKGDLIVKGTVVDDDGAASVFYSINSKEAVEIKTHGYFQFVVPGLPAGTHQIEVWGKDVTGVVGNKTAIKGIVVPIGAPKPRLSTVTSTAPGRSNDVREFFTGMTLRPEAKGRITIDFTVAGAPVSAASIAFGDQSPIQVKPGAAGKDGLQRATVPLPANLSSGFTKIELRATDRNGIETVYDEYAYIRSLAEGTIALPSDIDNSLFWVRPNTLDDGRVLLDSADAALYGITESPINTVNLTGQGADNIASDVDANGRVVLRALREGTFGPLTIVASTGTGAIRSPAVTIIASFAPPTVRLQDAADGRWVQGQVPVRFNVSSPNRITSVQYSVDMGTNWLNFPSQAGLGTTSMDINYTIDISSADDGSVNILIRAVNEAGLASPLEGFTVLKDTKPPEVQLIMPEAEASVNGTIRVGFIVKENGSLRTASYTRPAVAAEGAAAINTEVFNSNDWDKNYAPAFLPVLMDSIQMPLDTRMRFVFVDQAGNRGETNYWPFVIDNEMDIPVAHIILPLDNEVITTDFVVSGVMFDDDAIRQVYWKIDNGREDIVVAKNGFSIPVYLSSLNDNEHTITVTAEDIYGVKSAPVQRKFRVSLSEPSAEITYPLFDTVLRDQIEITGTSFDRNGIEELKVSIDNGNSYNKVTGTERWSYKFNTKILKDGPNVVFVRVWDKYGIPATYASMINVDNTAPEIILDSPGDGSKSIGKVQIMGRTIDPNLETVSIEMRSLEGYTIRADIGKRSLGAVPVLKETLDISAQRDGLYNLEIVATDKAGNITRISRNVQLARETTKNTVDIFYPLDNENVQGSFNLYGFTYGTDPAGSVTIRINGVDRDTVTVGDSGYYRFSLDQDKMEPGINKVTVHSSFGGVTPVFSREQNLIYKEDGPWVTIDTISVGDFAFERPYLSGRTGFTLSQEDRDILISKEASKEEKEFVKSRIPLSTELSFDNGKTFVKANKALAKDIDYRYRLETGEMAEGMHYILVRATMKSGETAVTRVIVQVDKTFPVIRLISPEAGGRYNEAIEYSASASDDVELTNVTYHLRQGDKASYEIPGFIQGLYFEGVIPPFIKQALNEAPTLFAGGATYVDAGLGLSFFDDNVKIQVQYGIMTQSLYDALGGKDSVRYGGHVLGLKLLASIYALPFGAIAGPDWEWLSATFALGANFSLFNIANEENPKYTTADKPVYYTQSGSPTWMSALLLQIEFPKVTIPKKKYLRTFSLFTEGQLWFVPTDVDAAKNNIDVIIPHIIMGLRLYIF